MNRDEANGWLVQTLLEKLEADPYPSRTQMEIIEEVIPQAMVPDYLQVLMDKVAGDQWPSVTMLSRIARVAATLPKAEPRRG